MTEKPHTENGDSTESTDEPADKLPFTKHLEELRKRLIWCFLALIVGFGACYNFSGELFMLLVQPLNGAMPEGSSLAMIKVTEGFLTHLKIALLAGVFLSCPVLFYQIWKFVAPGLYPGERKYVWPFVAAATLFFLMGAGFAYGAVFPWGLKFLLSFAGEEIQASLSIESYLGFSTKLLLAFGLVFELPVVVFFLARMGLVHYKTLARVRGYALVVIFIVAAVLTPPDVFTQVLMAGPLYALYEISILVARVFGPKDDPEEEEEAAA